MSTEMAPNRTAATPEAIAFRLRISVTGHRNLPDDPALLARVQEAVVKARALVPQSPHTPVRLAIISPLAEGADRLVTRVVLDDHGAILNAVLPFPCEDYAHDFADEGSRKEFDDLLAQAQTVVTLPETLARDSAYAAVGHYVLTHSNVLIAIWDGKPTRGRGGTAEVVTMARAAEIPLLWIESTAPYTLHEETFPTTRPHQGENVHAERDGALISEQYAYLDEYNRDRVADRLFARNTAREWDALAGGMIRAGVPSATGEPSWVHLLPHYVKADALAQRYQQRFTRFAIELFWLAAAAVLVIAVQSQFAPTLHRLAVVEIACLLAILVINRLGKHRRLHERYLSYRFLAERLRARLFLVLVDAQAVEKHDGAGELREGAQNTWVNAALAEIWRECPSPQWLSGDPPVAALQRFIGDAWLRDQIAYQTKAGKQHTGRHRSIERWSYVFFALALIVAVMHVAGVGGGAEAGDMPLQVSMEGLLVILSLGLPAIFSALHGIEIQGEYERNADRARQMARLLTAVAHNVDDATTLPTLRTAAWQAESVLLEENRDWFVLMHFRDFEIHV